MTDVDWRKMTWDYPAKKAGILTIFVGMSFLLHMVTLDAIYRPDRWQLDYYILSLSLVIFGTGCAFIVYHYLKSGEEDTAVKKKIALVGIAVGAPVAALRILDLTIP